MAQSFPVLGDLRCSPVSISRVRPEPSDFGIEVHSSSTPGSDSHGALEIDAACVVGELVRGLATRSYTPTELTAELQSVERACERALHSEAESHECSPQYLEGLTGDLQKLQTLARRLPAARILPARHVLERLVDVEAACAQQAEQPGTPAQRLQSLEAQVQQLTAMLDGSQHGSRGGSVVAYKAPSLGSPVAAPVHHHYQVSPNTQDGRLPQHVYSQPMQYSTMQPHPYAGVHPPVETPPISHHPQPHGPILTTQAGAERPIAVHLHNTVNSAANANAQQTSNQLTRFANSVVTRVKQAAARPLAAAAMAALGALLLHNHVPLLRGISPAHTDREHERLRRRARRERAASDRVADTARETVDACATEVMEWRRYAKRRGSVAAWFAPEGNPRPEMGRCDLVAMRRRLERARVGRDSDSARGGRGRRGESDDEWD